MKKQLLSAAFLLNGMLAFAQTANDPIIMTVAGTPVLRSEFEYSYNKNNSEGVIDKKTVDEYVDLFINYKLSKFFPLHLAITIKINFAKKFI